MADRLAYTPNEVADMLGVDPKTVRRMIQARLLRAVVTNTGQIYPRYLVPADALDEFLAGRGPAPATADRS